MSNAAKHRKKAAEFEQLKQIDRAIASYVKAIEESEAAGEDVDVALYNKVGDLALRQGRVPDAITYYERAVEHYATSGLFNNAIALCNKILRNAPGRANVYFTLGRISARKGLRGDATRNFLEYATRMQQDGRIEEGIRALAEVLDIMPELNDVRTMVDDLAARSGIALPRRRTPLRSDRQATPVSTPAVRDQKSQDLIFLDIDYGEPSRRTPVRTAAVPTPRPLPLIPTVITATPPIVDAVAPVDGFEGTSADVAPLAELENAIEAQIDLVADSVIDRAAESPSPELPMLDTGDPLPVEPALEGLEANGDFAAGAEVAPLEGFTPDETLPPADLVDAMPPLVEPSAETPTEVTWIVPPDEDAEAVSLDEVVIEDYHDAVNDPGVVRAIYTATPAFVPQIVPDADIDAAPLELEQIEVEPVPELDEAIAAGAAMVAHAAAEEQARLNRPPFRLDPHDFILPGELPPLLLDDRIVEAGLASTHDATDAVGTSARASTADVVAQALGTLTATPVSPVPATPSVASVDAGSDAPGADTSDAQIDTIDGAPTQAPESIEHVQSLEALDLGDALADEEYVEGTDESLTPVMAEPAGRPVSVTPSLPIAAVAEAAASVASSRRDSLRSAVARMPKNWLLRRRLAEALFEAGERDAALHELETAQQGLVHEGEFSAASDIADELVHVSPDRVAYHQKRVELAVRTNDQQRLRLAYLDLADALVRLGEEGRARAVYARVLEIDPYDDRARAALGAAAPPPPPPTPRSDEKFVDLADWLRDDGAPVDTRMRMREPAISGDEQADFDALLQHFKEGVSRSLGEDDFESHYDLGVAYKEMGLLDDAIAEFQKALRSRAHRLPAYEALGQCFVEQERYQVAATVLSRALHEPGLDDDQRVGVLYLLGYSCEALQRKDEARSYFQRVYATDINFRDVAARLVALEQASR